jgi:hypothetical protein
VEHTSLGLYVNSVQGIKADNSDRTYWQILSGDKPLEEGKKKYANTIHRIKMPKAFRCEVVTFYGKWVNGLGDILLTIW